jgi:pyruvate dehydrogenase E2 component (dihydrolipoamide acetyltransferase)
VDVLKVTSERQLCMPAVCDGSAGGSARAYASPGVFKLARELGVSLSQLAGSAANARITAEDVRAHVRRSLQGLVAGTAQPPATAEAAPAADSHDGAQQDDARFGPVERRELSRIRKRSAALLHRNWTQIPHVTNHDEADITALDAFRERLDQEHRPLGTKITLLPFLIKACITALKKWPEFNASFDGDALLLKRYFHIGFAADTPDGLVVPVIRDADKKGLIELARECAELASTAREGKLTPAQMCGGSFTISSLGGIGGSYFTPIINAREVAILGVGKARTEVMWDAGQVRPRLVLPLSLSWDHRAVDGAAAARFNTSLTQVLADLRLAVL